MKEVIVPPLFNPESAWEPASEIRFIGREDITKRIGPFLKPFKVLSGGLANTNVLLGQDQVLRIYRRDPKSMGKEAALLGITWSSFRVPRILKTGSDFLLLEYVPHSSLQDTAEHGEILGRALSEIHSVKYETSGELNSDLKTEEPLEDLIAVMGNYALGFLDQPSLAPLSNLKDSFKAFLSSQGEALRQMSLPPVLIHGDFKASNLHRAENNQPLVLDWEFAYAGPAWMDIGQLFRWSPSEAFKFGFEVGYGTRKRAFPEDWLDWAAAFDLFNLMGLLEKSELGSKRAKDVVGLIQHTFDKFK